MPGKVGAPYGNTNAQKWTLSKTKKLYKAVVAALQETDMYYVGTLGKKVEGYKHHSIQEVYKSVGISPRLAVDVFNRHGMHTAYADIKSIVEANCYSDAKKGIIVPSLAIINLKSNFGWTDRVESKQEVEHKGSVQISSWLDANTDEPD